jgi:hypothetical protein
MSVTLDGVSIGRLIAHLHNLLLHFTNDCHTQTSVLSLLVPTSRFLVMASNSGDSSASVLTSMPAGS